MMYETRRAPGASTCGCGSEVEMFAQLDVDGSVLYKVRCPACKNCGPSVSDEKWAIQFWNQKGGLK